MIKWNKTYDDKLKTTNTWNWKVICKRQEINVRQCCNGIYTGPIQYKLTDTTVGTDGHTSVYSSTACKANNWNLHRYKGDQRSYHYKIKKY